ncbi:hypothetical protein lerEdw1_012145 [Lerista edwardsae]|nr:hypothetical protein lerEdw1_012145 [Lerista edwardsae]
MWKSSKISTLYFMDKDSKLSNFFQQASSPTTGTAPRSQSRLSVCPSTQDICRYVIKESSTLHDISEDKSEKSTPVTVLTSASKDPGKRQVKRRVRRRKVTEENGERAEKPKKEKDSTLHPKVTNPRWNALRRVSSDSTSSDENHWALVRKRERAKMPKRTRRRSASNTQPGGSSCKTVIELATLGTNGEKKQEVTEGQALNHRRRKISRCEETRPTLSSISSVETRNFLRQCGKHNGTCSHKDPEAAAYNRRGKVSKEESGSERGSGSDPLSVPQSGAPVGAGPAVTTAVQKPPVLYDDWSDDCEVCRFVPYCKRNC